MSAQPALKTAAYRTEDIQVLEGLEPVRTRPAMYIGGFEYRQSYSRGIPQGKVEKVGPFRGHGTGIYFEPDETIFKTVKFDADTLKARLEDMSYIHSGLKITFKNEVSGETVELANPGG